MGKVTYHKQQFTNMVYMSDLLKKKNIKRRKINTDLKRVCEVCRKINYKNCGTIAYRQIVTRWGLRWICDAGAKELCRQSDVNAIGKLTG